MSEHDIFSKEFGPVLYALGEAKNTLFYRVLFYAQTPPTCSFDGRPITGEVIESTPHGDFWSFTINAAAQDTDTRKTYTINGKTYNFTLPAKSAKTLRVAYASCNGSEADSPQKPPFPGRNALWEHLEQTHAQSPFHLLIQGGDQLYADSVWRDIPFLARWKTLPRAEQYTAALPDEIYIQIRDYYRACYMTYWSQPHIHDVLATIPSIMIWDDHDIFDGWGSWNSKYQKCAIYQGIFRAAREAFYLFQRGQSPSKDDKTAATYIKLGHTAFLAPDLRTERTRKQVMGEAGWSRMDDTLKTLAGHADEIAHMILISSVPLATSHFSLLDPILTGFPSFIARRLPKKINPKQFADDIHDQWRVPAHRDEWLQMLNTLFDFGQNTKTRVTTLSGEIHLGARSTIRRDDTIIHQFIASGIAHKPAHPAIVWACEMLSKGVQDIDDHIDIRIAPFFPRGNKKYLRARNWLALELHKDQKLLACWHAENQEAITFKD